MRYLDHAATSWPKPPEVLAGWLAGMEIAGAAGRGGHSGSREASEQLQRTREAIARFFRTQADRVVFQSSGTEALNLALLGLLKSGDHVVTTAAEHNAVLRPLEHLRNTAGISLTILPVDPMGSVSVGAVLAACRPETCCVAVSHASNVTGTRFRIEELGGALRDSSTLLLVDAAQTAGHLPIELDSFGIDLLATSGHKGLLGPLGTGLLLLSARANRLLRPIRFGGTGTESERLEMPCQGVQRFECGVPNVPAWMAQRGAVEWIERRGMDSMREHQASLTRRLWERLETMPGIRRLGPAEIEQHCGPTSIVVPGWDPHDLASILDASFDIRVRAGRHCAALMHEYLDAAAGTLRITPGWSNTIDDIDALVESLVTVVGT